MVQFWTWEPRPRDINCRARIFLLFRERPWVSPVSAVQGSGDAVVDQLDCDLLSALHLKNRMSISFRKRLCFGVGLLGVQYFPR